MAKSLTDRLAELETLSTAELCARWQRASGRPAPKRARDLLLRALAYRLQEKAEGGLSKAARRRLGKLAGLKGEASQPPVPPSPRLRPGSRLVREWRGEAHQVTVLEKGFEYGGAPYGSLSQIAREITGTRWSGPRFFGLRMANDPSNGASHGR